MNRFLILALIGGTLARTADFYVSASAQANSGDGSISAPWPIRTAFAQPSTVRPGDTIWLRGGIYRGKFICQLTGEPGRPITVRAYPGEWVTVDGNNRSTLIFGIGPADTTITVSDPSDFVPGAEVRIEQEEIYVRSRSGNQISIVRGWAGTTPKTHPAMTVLKPRAHILAITGRYVWFWDFELMSSDPIRTTPISGSVSVDISRGTGIDVRTPGIKLINLVVHDAADAIGFWEAAEDGEISGAIIYHNGWQAPDRGHGHGIYIQNRNGKKLIRDVISFNNFATGMKVFGEAGWAVGVDFDGVISFNNGSVRQSNQGKEVNLYVGTGSQPGDLISISNSFLYHSIGTRGENLHIGYVSPNKRVRLTDSYVAGGSMALDMTRWEQAVVRGNTFYVPSLGGWSAQALISLKTINPSVPLYDWNSNTYYDGAGPFGNGVRYTFGFNDVKNQLGGGILSYGEWQRASGFDIGSRYDTTPPHKTEVFVRPSTHESGRANIAVFNWEKRAAIEIDLSHVLRIGDTYSVRDAQNYYGEAAASGIYDGQPVSIRMDQSRVVTPIGNVPTTPAHTAPFFGAFVVVTRPTLPDGASDVGRGGQRYRQLPFFGPSGRRPQRDTGQ